MVCLPNGAPKCAQCPARPFCTACREGTWNVLPVKRKKTPRRMEEKTVFVLLSSQGVALRQRAAKGLLAGLWEYPNEPVEECAIPALLGLAPEELEPAGQGRHIFTHIEWRMQARTARIPAEALPEGWVWADRQALAQDYAVPNAFQAFRDAVDSRLGYF